MQLKDQQISNRKDTRIVPLSTYERLKEHYEREGGFWGLYKTSVSLYNRLRIDRKLYQEGNLPEDAIAIYNSIDPNWHIPIRRPPKEERPYEEIRVYYEEYKTFSGLYAYNKELHNILFSDKKKRRGGKLPESVDKEYQKICSIWYELPINKELSASNKKYYDYLKEFFDKHGNFKDLYINHKQYYHLFKRDQKKFLRGKLPKYRETSYKNICPNWFEQPTSRTPTENYFSLIAYLYKRDGDLLDLHDYSDCYYNRFLKDRRLFENGELKEKTLAKYNKITKDWYSLIIKLTGDARYYRFIKNLILKEGTLENLKTNNLGYYVMFKADSKRYYDGVLSEDVQRNYRWVSRNWMHYFENFNEQKRA
ncbi:hypothetical protein M2146_001159 [Lachnospiraceae bacterium PF1-22]